MKVLILGCGYTGQRLAQLLNQQNVEVYATNRSGTPLRGGLNMPMFPFACATGAHNIPLPAAALENVTHVVSTIAPDEQGIDPVAASLMPMLQGAKLQWFGYLSTTGVYGDTQGAWVDEDSPLNPQNVRSQHRVTIEATFLHSGLPAHIFRLPGIYGPGRSILDKLRAGTAQHISKPGHVFSRIHVDDIVQTLGESMRSPQPGAIYNVADDEPSESGDLIRWGAKLLNLSPPVAQPFDQVNLSPMAASFWSECRRIRNTKMKQTLGIQLKYPTYREGLQSIFTAEIATQL
jgi:nucleoside-diphosphate-sugar epimerase